MSIRISRQKDEDAQPGKERLPDLRRPSGFEHQARRTLRVAALLLVLAVRLAIAQASSGTVSGVVRDSIARVPLAGALVQLVAADTLVSGSRAVVSDSLGRFSFGAVPNGRYLLGFLHPLLDSLGLEPRVREVNVSTGHPMHADLGVPSPASLRNAICAGSERASVIVGIVRDAGRGSPMAGATVTGQWLELTLGERAVRTRVARLVATTAPNGWFALCNVPKPGALTLIVSRGGDSTGLIDVHVSDDGFVRRDLYVGQARSIATLRGTVTNADGRKPLAGAMVTIPNGPQARANERGEWTIVDAPLGTQMLEIRAPTFHPERRTVNVVAGLEPVLTSLSTMKAMLDTAGRATVHFDAIGDTGFQRRRRSLVGYFMTSEQITRANATVTSDLFRHITGVRLDGSRNIVLSSGAGWCAPAFYVDGQYLQAFSSGSIDDLIRLSEIVSIEIYAGNTAPTQFRPSGSDCGSIAISTERGQARRRAP